MSAVFVITGPSGVGKGTLIRALRELPPGQPTEVGVLRRGQALTVGITPTEK